MHPGLGGRSPIGALSIVAGELHFNAGDVLVQMPLSGLQVHAGGLNNEQFLIQHAARPGWVITTSSRSLLQELAARGDTDLKSQIASASRRRVAMTKFYLFGGVFLLIVAGALLLLFLLKSTLARAVANRLPASWEQQFGDAAIDSIRKQMKIVDDPKWNAQLDVVKARLLPSITNSTYPIQIYVADAPELNAFALPGGHIVVFTGLLKAIDKPEELAGVLAHEIAHVTERHVLRRLIESVGLILVIQALFGDTSGLLAVATDSSEILLRQKFSRDFEREADELGWTYLIRAGINPRGMIDFFIKLEKETAGTEHLSLLNTHPATKERIQRLEEKWKALGQPKFAPLAREP